MKALLLILLFTSCVFAQNSDPQSTPRAGVQDLAYKTGALGINPAALGPDRGYHWSVELPSLSLGLANDAFGVNFFNQHFAGDHFYTEAEKQTILGKIPSHGLRSNLQVSVPVTSVQISKFAFSLAAESDGQLTMPKDFARFAFEGLSTGQSISIKDLGAESQNILDLAGGFAYQFDQEWVPDLYFGAAFHFYQGVFLAKLVQHSGTMTIGDSMLSAGGVLHAVTSKRGDGVGFDLGGLAVVNSKLEVGLALRQIGARITWDVDKNNFLSAHLDSSGIVTDTIKNSGGFKHMFNSVDTSYGGGAVETQLPVLIQANARYVLNPKFTFLGDAIIRTQNSVQGDAGLEVGAAAEFSPIHVLVLQSGLAVGGPWNLRFGLGLGIRAGGYGMDIGGTWNGGLFNAAHGLGFSLSQRLLF